ncbi:MAG: hypothetical protein AB1486_10510 [Planctomycetota bacterium]
MIEQHEFFPEPGETAVGHHTVIDIGDVGHPAVPDDDPDGFDDYAILDDLGQQVLVYDGRSGTLAHVIATPTTCGGTPPEYGGFGASGDGGKNITGDETPDFVIGAARCNFA